MLGAGGEEEGEDEDVRRGSYDPRRRKGGRKLGRKVLVKKRRGEDMGVMGMKGSSPHVIVKRLGKAAEVVPYSPPGGNVITYSNTKNTVIPDANTVIPLAPSKRRGGGRALPNSSGRRRGGGRRRRLLDLPEETRRSSIVQGREEMEEEEAGDSLPTSRLLGRVKVTPSSSVRKARRKVWRRRRKGRRRRKVCRRRRKGSGRRYQTTF